MLPVCRLILPSGPPAVVRIVSLIVVDAVKRKPVWRLAHVNDKVGVSHRARPAFADRYTASAIAVIRWMTRHTASHVHRVPLAI